MIERGGRTAIIDGVRIKLPPTEFDLLEVLAAHPGEVVPHKELAAAAFGDTATAPHDLHWRLSKLRGLVGDRNRGRDEKLIENRRGLGYALNLRPSSVTVLDGVATKDPGAETSSVALEPQASAPLPTVPRRSLPRRSSVLTLTAVAVVALSASWAAGYLLSRSRDQVPVTTAPRVRQPGGSEPDEAEQRPLKRKGTKSSGEGGKRRAHGDGGSAGAAPLAAPDAVGAPNAQPQQVTSERVEPTRKEDARAAKRELPPAPEGYLYHLVDRKTGDHFVTTDVHKANEYRGKGYEGGAIARLYTQTQEHVATRRISLNFGTGYVFATSSPETEPRVAPIKLYYASNGEGDFFYTTEASADGWETALIGYVRPA